jgi:glycerol transport system permease protein
MKIQKRTFALLFYFLLLVMPIYWMLNMSLRSNADILSVFSLYPSNITFDNYIKVFTDPTWYSGYINAMIYVSLNTVMSLAFALPAAYAFSRYKFLGDGQMFFWLLTNRMAPPAVFLLPYFQLYSTVNLIDTTLPWPWHIAFSTYRWRYGSWKALCPAFPKKSMKRPLSTGTPFHGFFSLCSFH